MANNIHLDQQRIYFQEICKIMMELDTQEWKFEEARVQGTLSAQVCGVFQKFITEVTPRFTALSSKIDEDEFNYNAMHESKIHLETKLDRLRDKFSFNLQGVPSTAVAQNLFNKNVGENKNEEPTNPSHLQRLDNIFQRLDSIGKNSDVEHFQQLASLQSPVFSSPKVEPTLTIARPFSQNYKLAICCEYQGWLKQPQILNYEDGKHATAFKLSPGEPFKIVKVCNNKEVIWESLKGNRAFPVSGRLDRAAGDLCFAGETLKDIEPGTTEEVNHPQIVSKPLPPVTLAVKYDKMDSYGLAFCSESTNWQVDADYLSNVFGFNNGRYETSMELKEGEAFKIVKFEYQ